MSNNLNIKGLDISNYMGNVNLEVAKEEGYKICLIEAGDGITFTNPYLEEQYNAVINEEMKVGFYHFFRAEDNQEEQAQAFFNQIKDKKMDILPILDVELTMGVSNVPDAVINFMEAFKNISGLDMILYSYPGFINQYLLDSRLYDLPLWVADYGVTNLPDDLPYKNIVGWQWTDKGNISGVGNGVDLDKFSEDIFMKDEHHALFTHAVQQATPQLPLWEKCIHGQLIMDLQTALNNQCGANLEVDGWFGDETLGACITVFEGAEGNITRVIQTRLTNLTYGVGGIDGIYGPMTKEAVSWFQHLHGLQVTGYVDKITWRTMMLLDA